MLVHKQNFVGQRAVTEKQATGLLRNN